MKNDTYFKHPLILLLLSVLLGSVLVPLISYYVNESKLKRNARFVLSDSIVERDLKINGYLNNLVSVLDMFDKDNCYIGDTSMVLEEQVKLKWEMQMRYVEFERAAWFWSEFVFHKAYSSDLRKKDLRQLSSYLRAYKVNLESSTIIVSKLWKECLSKEYIICNEAMREQFKVSLFLLARATDERTSIVHDMLFLLRNKGRRTNKDVNMMNLLNDTEK